MKILELIAALILSAILFPFALIFNIFLLKKGSILKTIWQVCKEISKLINDTFRQIAIWIDRLGNVILGNMFERALILKKYWGKTLFDKSEITISASLGDALDKKMFNKKGYKFASMIDYIFSIRIKFFEIYFVEKNHCVKAFEWYLINKNFKDTK